MKKHIPNIITCCNLLSGSAAVVFACRGNFTLAFSLILLGAFFDFFDGLSARSLHVGQPIGKELDSLADDITFGLAPTLMLFTYIYGSLSWWALSVLPMAALSAMRLAKFNLDERQTSSFIGLATPANAIFWGSLIAFLNNIDYAPLWLNITLIISCFIACYLLNAEIPFFSLKFHDLKWQNNKVRFIFIIGSTIILCALIITSVILKDFTSILPVGTAIILWYIILSLFTNKSIDK